MDLSFPPFTPDHELHAWPAELAVLLVGLAARQAGSVTAAVQAGLDSAGQDPPDPDRDLLAPRHGAFHAATAAMLNERRRP